MPASHPNQNTDDSLVEKGSVEALRVLRVWRLLYVQFGTWLFFAFYLAMRGFVDGSRICFTEAAVMFAIAILSKGERNRSYAGIMHVSLTASAIGLVTVSLSASSLQRTMFFYSASILIASQLLGVRAAFYWTLMNVVGHFTFFWAAYGLDELWNQRLDELTLTCGTAFCLFFCCQHGEALFKARTRDLIDLSERLRQKSKLLHGLATTDSLTGLLNRHQFHIELQATVERAVATHERMALLLLDMDGFKEVNDTLGHQVGDFALVEIASRLKQYFSKDAIVARLGGDEFCVIIPNVGSAHNAGLHAAKTCDLLKKRYVFEDVDFPLGSSVGIALCPDDTHDAAKLQIFSDTAMFRAKEARMGFAHYDASMTDQLNEFRTLQEHLLSALEREEFFLVYQPQVCMATGKVVGAEALLRWRRDGEVISPARFIPILEKTREIINVGQWIIWEACRQLHTWEQMGINIEMSINVSPVQFKDDNFNPSIERSMNEFGIQASKLDFEITESLLIEDVDQAIAKLVRLKKIGAKISIDDFGTGYSSLAYLRQFPLDRLKIDRTFVKDIPLADDGVIASSIVALSKAIGVKVLAEGVETAEQLEYLKSLDCDEYQGYFYSRPLPADEFEAFMDDSNRNIQRTLPSETSLTQ